MKRVLVTGATGFVGRHLLAPLLARGYEVHAVARQAGQANGVVWHEADLLKHAEVTALAEKVKATHLLHAAWYAVHGKYWTAQENVFWVSASLDLLRAFAEQGGTRVLMLGSCAEYDWTIHGDAAWKPDRPCVPATPYGAAKHATARMLLSFAARYGISAAWARLFLLFGEDEHPERLVSSICISLLKEEEARCASGRPVRDFLDSRDAGERAVRILDSDAQGALNLSSGCGVAIADVARHLGNIAGRPDLIALGALPDRPGDPPFMVGDALPLPPLSEAVLWQRLEEIYGWWKIKIKNNNI
ncbi:MAG: NAD-dependent epimerase/dehydratase family protein [Alphaproteobacteria bacterium]|nr:NAD-dependent epimerase/dehydratase family protein [Alphaproteobacteria bacterium]